MARVSNDTYLTPEPNRSNYDDREHRQNNAVLIRYDPDYDENLAADVLVRLMFLLKLALKPVLESFIRDIDQTSLSVVSEVQMKIDQFLRSSASS